MPRIIKENPDITWDEFKEKYWKLFPISYEPKRIEKLKAEFEKLTGKKVEESGKPKRVKSKGSKVNTGGSESQSTFFGESTRTDGNES